MNQPIRPFLILCAVLWWTAPRLPAPIVVPDEAPAATPAKKRVHKVVHKEPVRRAKPTSEEEAPAEASPAPAPAPGGAAESVRQAVVKAEDGTETTYTLTATQPFGSSATGQKITLTIAESGVHHPPAGDKKTLDQPYSKTQATSINTGRTKSVSQLRDLMRSAFGRFASGAFTPGQELGKVGDARYGGELRFVAETTDLMRFDYVPATANTLRFRRADIQKFAELLAQ